MHDSLPKAFTESGKGLKLLLLQVRTNTLVKSAIIQVDSTPFKQFYLQHYGIELGLKKKIAAVEEATGGQEHITSQAEKVQSVTTSGLLELAGWHV